MSVDGEFKRLTAKDRLCAAVLKAVRENDTAALRRLGFGGFAQYAGRLSELMTASVREGLDWSPDFPALMRQVNSPVRYAHHLVNECGAAVQTALDERNGLRLRVVQPEYNDGRTKAIVGEAAESDSEHAADNLATQLGTEVKDAGNEFMKQNAEQRSSAGFKVTVERTGGTNCCPWCADRIGRWELKDAPKDVFGCHDNCTCMVEYTNSRGVRSQRLGRSRFVEVNYEPKRLTDGAERGAGEPKRLTGGANGGILNLARSVDVPDNFTFLNSAKNNFEKFSDEELSLDILEAIEKTIAERTAEKSDFKFDNIFVGKFDSKHEKSVFITDVTEQGYSQITTLYLNSQYFIGTSKADIDTMCKNLKDSGWWQSECLEDLVNHEILHARLGYHSGVYKTQQMEQLISENEKVKGFCRLVDQQPGEFMNEVFVALKRGEAIDKQYLDIYNRYAKNYLGGNTYG